MVIPFEIHITVSSLSIEEDNQFIAFCARHEGKPLVIELSGGVHTHQPMFTKVIFANSFNESLSAARHYAGCLDLQGLKAARIKIEVPAYFSHLFSAGTQSGFAQYFEWHGKVIFNRGEALTMFCETHKAHLSLNALKNNADIRFITLREYGGSSEFQKRVSELTAGLKHEGWELIKHQAEYCIYDNNCTLDKGWLPE